MNINYISYKVTSPKNVELDGTGFNWDKFKFGDLVWLEDFEVDCPAGKFLGITSDQKVNVRGIPAGEAHMIDLVNKRKFQ